MKIFNINNNYGDDNYDDLNDCLRYNAHEKIKSEEIEGIMAEVCGENDDYDWWWILKMKNGFALISGGCDYTGWDCESQILHESLHETLEEALKASPTKEDYSGRNIQENLKNQLEGKEPIGIYRE